LDSAEFQTWLNNGTQTLFCPGIPGAGKTIMTSIVINHLWTTFQNNATIGVAYLYFNFRRQHDQRLDDLLLCLLKQLVQEQSLPDSVRVLYDHHKNKQTRPSSEDISIALQSVTGAYSRVFIIVDALDECQTIGGCRVKFLSEIFNLQAKTGANLFITSRIHGEIAKLFDSSLSLEIRASKEDTETYLNRQMSFLQPDILNDGIRDMIRREIVQAVDGMYVIPVTKI
jgi:Cdc6-like AAA superfamily ATPase